MRAYFPSIDHGILRAVLARRVQDPAFLRVLDEVLARGAGVYADPRQRAFARLEPDWPPAEAGLPIGAYTSQFLAAHVYLLELDHRVRRLWRVPGYVRYVDDLFLLGDSRRLLEGVRDELAAWLREERRLLLKAPRARVRSCHGHLDALGCRIDAGGMADRRSTCGRRSSPGWASCCSGEAGGIRRRRRIRRRRAAGCGGIRRFPAADRRSPPFRPGARRNAVTKRRPGAGRPPGAAVSAGGWATNRRAPVG